MIAATFTRECSQDVLTFLKIQIQRRAVAQSLLTCHSLPLIFIHHAELINPSEYWPRAFRHSLALDAADCLYPQR